MLTDSQVERYSRQILLPRVGSRGQERLFESVAAIRGGGDAAVACASYLCGAGVGRLWVGEIGAMGAAGRALTGGRAEILETVVARSPDCRLLDALPDRPSVTVTIAPALPRGDSADAAVLWGGASENRIACVSVPPGGCLECARHAAAGEDCRSSSVLLGSVLALQALRALLGFAEDDPAALLRFDVVRLDATRSALPRRADCAACIGRSSTGARD